MLLKEDLFFKMIKLQQGTGVEPTTSQWRATCSNAGNLGTKELIITNF